jgi:hypothetical protein
MTKKYHKRRHFKGGFLGSFGQTMSNLGNSITQSASTAWNSTKKALGVGSSTASSYSPSTTSNYTQSNYTSSTPSSSYKYGGKKGRKMVRSRKNKKGGLNPNGPLLMADRANQPISTLANNAASFSGAPSASVSYVGGKTGKRTRRRSKH